MRKNLLSSLDLISVRAVLALAAALCASTALAQNSPASGGGAAAASSDSSAAVSASPVMTLQAAASSDIKQDTVVITVATEVDATDQSSAGKKLSSALDDLFKRANGTPGVDVRTGDYRVWPNNNKGKLVSWHGQGSIVLESTNFEAASALAGKLSDKSAIANINFTLSRSARDATERKLLNQAAQAFRERALAAASAFGFSGYRIQKLELGGSGAMVVAPRAFMAMAKGNTQQSDPDAPLMPGNVTVSIEVNGTIVLQ